MSSHSLSLASWAVLACILWAAACRNPRARSAAAFLKAAHLERNEDRRALTASALAGSEATNASPVCKLRIFILTGT